MRSLLSSIRRIVDAAFAVVGLAVFIRKKDYHYVPDFYGRNAHKMQDPRRVDVFGRVALSVVAQGRTLLYYDRLYVLFQCLAQVAKRTAGSLRIAEVGVFKGGGGAFLLSVANELGIKDVELHGFDTFEGHAQDDIDPTHDDVHEAGMFSETSLESVQAYLSKSPGVHLHKGRIQETSHLVKGLQFGLVHLDVDLYRPTMHALEFFDMLLTQYGIMVIDDYGFSTCNGVKSAVDQFIETRPNYFFYHTDSGQCLLVRLDAQRPSTESPALDHGSQLGGASSEGA